jgi:hypothetical protein
LENYKRDHLEFLEALKRGKEVVDITVENALYKKAIGYTYEEVTREPIKDPETGEYRLEVTKIVKKEVQPDTTAQIFWLKNRKPAEWRDKHEQEVEITGLPQIVIKRGDTVD